MTPIASRPHQRARGRRRLAQALVATTLLVAPPLAAARVDLRLRQPNGRPLAGAILYVLPLDARRLPAPAAAVMDQRDRRFVPQILPVQTGASVSFPNTDSISHHVYSFSPAKRFELYLPKVERRGSTAAHASNGTHAPAARSPRDTTAPLLFDRPGIVALGCNIHDWMLAYILVVDTPWFDQADAQGLASIPDLPAGRYRLVVWHPRITDGPDLLEREVRLAADAVDRWEVDLRSALLPSRDQEPGFKEY